MPFTDNYVEELKNRARQSRVYRKHQLAGLEAAQMLQDEGHTSLYIKLAKQGNAEKLLGLAKEISKNKKIRNKGAYFMKVWANQ